jgi:hypothetical protein
MVNPAEVTRARMGDTRAALSEKLESLEQRMADTVHGAADAVANTVENVKDVVHETVLNVRDTFDIPLQVERHPWAMLGGSLALGFLGGYLLYRFGARSAAIASSAPTPADMSRIGEQHNGTVKDARPADAAMPPDREAAPRAVDGATPPFATEIARLKSLAIGALLSIGRDVITQSAPESMHARLTEVIDGLTVQLGGEPIRGPVLKRGETAADRS